MINDTLIVKVNNNVVLTSQLDIIRYYQILTEQPIFNYLLKENSRITIEIQQAKYTGFQRFLLNRFFKGKNIAKDM